MINFAANLAIIFDICKIFARNLLINAIIDSIRFNLGHFKAQMSRQL